MRKRSTSPEGEKIDVSRRARRRARFAAPAALAAALVTGDGRVETREGDPQVPDELGDVREAQALRRLATHPDSEVRVRLAGWLPSVLEWMSRPERTEIIATWSTSRTPAVRLAMARALRYAPPALGSHSAIEHLAGDPDPQVRVAIAEAAWLRRRESPDRLIGVLAKLADDRDPMVREVARLALGDA